MNQSPPLYVVQDLCRRYGEREVLNIPHLTLEAGMIYGLLGPNGAGKTTLMRLLSFMDTPTQGSITFRGQIMTPSTGARQRSRVVWVPQFPVLFTGTVLYNIEYPMGLKGISRQERRTRAMALLENVRLAHLAQAPAHRLSGGEAQRASIARALAAGAQVIMFDEPTANVDHRSREEIMAIIGELWQNRGLSIFITTHDKSLADELCQEHITLFDGHVASRLVVRQDATILPRTLTALPATLTQKNGTLTVQLQSTRQGASSARQGDEALAANGTSLTACLRGLAATSEGVTLRLVFPSGQSLDVLVQEADHIPLAGQAILNAPVQVQF